MYAMGSGSIEAKLDELGRRVEMLTFTLKLHQDFVERIAVVLHRNKSDDNLDQLFERVEKLAAERDKALDDAQGPLAALKSRDENVQILRNEARSIDKEA